MVAEHVCKKGFVIFWQGDILKRNNNYICSMRKELGKWLMDVAKYLFTVVLLASVFSDIHEEWFVKFAVIFSIVLTLSLGLWLINDKKE